MQIQSYLEPDQDGSESLASTEPALADTFSEIHEQKELLTEKDFQDYRKRERDVAINRQVDDIYDVIYTGQGEQIFSAKDDSFSIKKDILEFLLWKQNWIHVGIHGLLEEEFRMKDAAKPDFFGVIELRKNIMR